MPRTARASVGGICYHVINRGNARAKVFHKEGDYEVFTGLALPSYEQRTDPDDGCYTGSLFVLEQDLGQERPERDSPCVHGIFFVPEAGVFVIERLLDGLLGQYARKGKTGALKKRGENQTKSLWQGTRVTVK